MPTLTTGRIIGIGVSLLLGIIALCIRGRILLPDSLAEGYTRAKKRRRNWMALGVIGLWLCCGFIIGIFASPSEGLHVDVMAPRVTLWGMDFSSSVVLGWVAMAALILIAVLIRLLVIPKFQEKPRGIQAVLETAVEFLANYTKEKVGFVSEPLNAYMFTVALFLVACAVVELFGFRPPTADLVATASLALCTFVMINYYGVKRKGVAGRIRSLASPTPVVFPFRLLSDIAIPVSLACRLFGNMLGGMIVVHLIYMALGAFGVGVPAVLGLYFNVFHPVIQVFIFITLSLTFIGEAVE